MLGRVKKSINYSSVDLDMASKQFNVCGVTLMYSREVRSASFYQKKATAEFRMDDMEQEEDSFNLL